MTKSWADVSYELIGALKTKAGGILCFSALLVPLIVFVLSYGGLLYLSIGGFDRVVGELKEIRQDLKFVLTERIASRK